MTSELNIQSQIMKDAEKICDGVFAMKMSNHFMSGIPDLILKVPGHEVMFIEVKKGSVGKDKTIAIKTTHLQRHVMKMMEKSGMRAEVWVVIEHEKELAMLRTVPEATKVICDVSSLPRRKRGEGWQIKEFLNNPVRRQNV